MINFLKSLAVVIAASLIGGCAATPTVDQNSVSQLAMEIQALGSDVDPQEAEQAARIAHSYSLQLAQEYQITDPPLIHNAKVTNGFRERGLCNHWTEDLNKRLKQERFDTLTLHWAISPPTTFRIIHHTVIVSAGEDTMYDGIVLDPWRYGGTLFWSQTQADERFNWRPRLEVREELIRKRAASSAG